MMYLGDYVEDGTVRFVWSTNGADGASITRATNGTVSVYKDNGTTQTTTGVTDTEDFDSLTGIHACTIVLTDAFYEAGKDYAVVLSGATIDGKSVNAVLAHFSIQNRYMRGTNSAALATDLATVDGIVDSILEDTGTTLPATLTTIDGVVDDILTDTGTTLPAAIAANGGDAPSAAAVANAVWGTALGAHAAGTAGHKLNLVALASQLQSAVANGTAGAAITGSYKVTTGTTWTAPITGLGDMTNRTKLYVAVKTAIDDTDAESIIQWTEGTGLTRLSGAATTAGYGSITVDDADNGDITLTLTVTATSGLSADLATGLTLAVKCIKSGEIWEKYGSNFEIVDGWIDAVS